MSQHPVDIKNLVKLLDDPDSEVYHSVVDAILEHQLDAMPYLENVLETSLDDLIVARATALLSKIKFNQIALEFDVWLQEGAKDLSEVLLILSKFDNSDSDISRLSQELVKIRKQIWLEYNQFLTPLEQINVFLNVLYKHRNFKDFRLQFEPEASKFYFLNTLFECNIGSELIISILYQIYFDVFDIPVKIYEVFPNKYYTAYISDLADNHQSILCFVQTSYGEVFSYDEMKESLQVLKSDIDNIQVLNTKSMIRRLLDNIALQYAKEKKLLLVHQANELKNML